MEQSLSTPALPSVGWGHVAAVPAASAAVGITSNLDTFVNATTAATSRSALIVEFLLSLHNDVNNSQLLQAQVAYVFFKHTGCPLLYSMKHEIWCVYDMYWKGSGSAFIQLKQHFQNEFIHEDAFANKFRHDAEKFREFVG